MKEKLKIDNDYYTLANKLYDELGDGVLKKKFIIGVSGESGSGKSTTGFCLNNVLENKGHKVMYLQMDDYFKLPAASNHQNRLQDLANIGPQEVNLALMQNHLNDFLEDRNTIGPESDFANNTFDNKPLSFEGASVLIVEGTYIPLLSKLDFLIFINIDYKKSIDNRINRGRESFDPFVEKVLDIEHHIIKEYRTKADIVVDVNYKIQKSHV